MGQRRKSREIAMQYLYQASTLKNLEEMPSKEFWTEAKIQPEVKTFAQKILDGALSHHAQIDALITQYALHWKIERIAAVDLAILRSAIAEMLFIPSTPPVVVIDEAVEIAKKYSTAESGSFVNGILDKIRKESVVGDGSVRAD